MKRQGLATLLTALIFVGDMLLPLGVAWGVLYVAVVLLALGSRERWPVLLAAEVSTLLVLAKWGLSVSEPWAWKVAGNRSLSIFVIWAVAVVGLYYVEASEKLRLMEQELAESRSLTALGRLAAVLAHEIRNPLGAVLTAGATLCAGGVSGGEARELRDVLERESGRLSRFMDEFLRLTRLHGAQPRECDLDQAMELVLETLRPGARGAGAAPS